MRFEKRKYEAICADMDKYILAIDQMLEKCVSAGVIKRDDITSELVKTLFCQDTSKIDDVMKRNGEDSLNNVSFALRDAIADKIEAAKIRVHDGFGLLWTSRNNDVSRYRNVSDFQKSQYLKVDNGAIAIDSELIKEHCTVYLPQDEKVMDIYNRALKIYKELAELDNELLKVSINIPIRCLGNLNDNALIQVEDVDNIWLDLPKLEDLDGSINKTVKNTDNCWHIQSTLVQ